MTTILIAPDKFKNSISAIEFCNICSNCLKSYNSKLLIKQFPLADGGDGTVEIIKYYIHGKLINAKVSDPLNRTIEAFYLYNTTTQAAYIEMAEASGLNLLNKNELNPLITSTTGTGELILDALKKGAKNIILGIGGSSTNDAGCGMASSLGYRFYDTEGHLFTPKGESLHKIATIDNSHVHPLLKQATFQIACDVENPIYGKKGAAYIYAPQKGANAKMVEQLDLGLRHFSALIEKEYQINLQNINGSGAAGGLGGGASVFLNAQLIKGIELIMNLSKIQECIPSSDFIITGEGKLDDQTLQGKVIHGLIKQAKNKKIIVICGQNNLTREQIKNAGIEKVYSIMNLAINLKDAMTNSHTYITKIIHSLILEYNI